MSTPNRMQTYWDQLALYLQNEWPKFSDTTIKEINGDYDVFLKHLKALYGNFPAEEAKARTKIQGFLNRIENNEAYRT